MDKTTLIVILFAHFVADFILQTDEQAMNKSTSNYWLTMHVMTYTAGMFVGTIYLLGPLAAVYYALFNGAIHWLQDWLTSRINSKLWKAEQRHWFFVGIGADQFIHYCSLILTFPNSTP